MASLYDLDRQYFSQLLKDHPTYRVEQIWKGLYNKGLQLEDITDLPKSFRKELALLEDFQPGLSLLTEKIGDKGKTIKWLWNLKDNRQIETVLMLYPKRATVCISSQAGCAMGCTFCATGQGGFERQLTKGEIVEQVIYAIRIAKQLDSKLTNIVFMGMGEPLANYATVWKSIRTINQEIGLAARHITVSTVGIVPGIKKMTQENLQVNLALSLHSANNDSRNKMIPIGLRYPIEDIFNALLEYIQKTHRRVSIEWALMDSINDSYKDASELADFANPLDAHVNLIPLNPTPNWPTKGSSAYKVKQFQSFLTSLGVNATIRHNRGTDISAACGQLAAENSPTKPLIKIKSLT